MQVIINTLVPLIEHGRSNFFHYFNSTTFDSSTCMLDDFVRFQSSNFNREYFPTTASIQHKMPISSVYVQKVLWATRWMSKSVYCVLIGVSALENNWKVNNKNRRSLSEQRNFIKTGHFMSIIWGKWSRVRQQRITHSLICPNSDWALGSHAKNMHFYWWYKSHRIYNLFNQIR